MRRDPVELVRQTASQSGMGYAPDYCPNCLDLWASRLKANEALMHDACKQALLAVREPQNVAYTVPITTSVRRGYNEPSRL